MSKNKSRACQNTEENIPKQTLVSQFTHSFILSFIGAIYNTSATDATRVVSPQTLDDARGNDIAQLVVLGYHLDNEHSVTSQVRVGESASERSLLQKSLSVPETPTVQLDRLTMNCDTRQ